MVEKYRHVKEARLNVAALLRAGANDDQEGIESMIESLTDDDKYDALVMMAYALGIYGRLGGTLDAMIAYLTGE